MNIKVGEKYQILSGPEKTPQEVMHIRAIVDRNYVVYRIWSKRKQMWRYSVESKYYLELLEKDERLIKK